VNDPIKLIALVILAAMAFALVWWMPIPSPFHWICLGLLALVVLAVAARMFGVGGP
jgi:uncharacterized membrane protein